MILLVHCGATAPIITDKDKFLRFDESFNGDKHFREVADETRANNVALKRRCPITLTNEKGQLVDIKLSNPFLFQSYPQEELFTVQAATENRARVDP